jgi:arylformamidase
LKDFSFFPFKNSAMEIYDLTHIMHSEMPVYPGKGQPVIGPAASIEKDGYREMRLELDGHTGTHMDAPAHMLSNGKMLNDFPISKFTGNAVIIPVESPTSTIDVQFIQPYEKDIQNSDFVLFRTGWSKYWGTNDYLRGFPVLSEQAAKWLTTFQLKGIGLDAISVDPVKSTTFAVHHILFQSDMVIVENLVFPENLQNRLGHFHCFPLKFGEADGSPVRAVMEVSNG